MMDDKVICAILFFILVLVSLFYVFRTRRQAAELRRLHETNDSLKKAYKQQVEPAELMKSLAMAGINYRIIYLIKLYGEDLTDFNVSPQGQYMGKVLWFKGGPKMIALGSGTLKKEHVIGVLFNKTFDNPDSPERMKYLHYVHSTGVLLSGIDCGLSLVCGKREDGNTEIWDYVDLIAEYERKIEILKLIEKEFEKKSAD